MKYYNATSSQRFLAFMIDYFIITSVASFILTFIPLYTFYANQLTDLLTVFLASEILDETIMMDLLRSAWVCVGLQTIVMLPLIIGYQVVLPLFWKHQTVGRLAAGVRVMKKDSSEKPSVVSLLVREIIGGYVFNNLLSQTFILPILNYVFSRNRGRSLSDMISKTRLVDIKLAKLQGLDENFVEENSDIIDADYNDVNRKDDEEVETEYKVF